MDLNEKQKATVGAVRDMIVRGRDQIGAALPAHLNVDRIGRIFLSTIQRNQNLLKCKPLSLVQSLQTCAQLGLEPDDLMGHVFLVPYKDECRVLVGYKGLIALIRRSPEVSQVYARVVHDGDEFTATQGTEESIHHVRNLVSPSEEVMAIYAVIRYRDGNSQFELMTREQVERIRQVSSNPNSEPWSKHWEEMAKKTVLRSLSKWAGVDYFVEQAVAIDERTDAGLSMPDAIDVTDLSPEATSGISKKLGRLEELTSQMKEAK